jgi:hypothetical protein
MQKAVIALGLAGLLLTAGSSTAPAAFTTARWRDRWGRVRCS